MALTHDVDRITKTYQYLTYPIKSLLKHDTKGFFYHVGSIFKKNPYWCFPEIIRIERKYDVKSTFYFLNETIPFHLFKISNWTLSLGRYRIYDKKVVDIIKYLDRNGWEIGLHGSYNSYKNTYLLKTEKKLLESIVGHEIIGIRQHYLNLEKSTWKNQKETGFNYDTSLGYRNDIGYKDEKFLPFHPLGDDYTVFPLVIMDSCFMDTDERNKKLSYLLDITEKNNSILVINWHQRSFNENEFPGYKKAYCDIIKECIKRGAIFRTLGDYYYSGGHNGKKEN